MTFKSRLAHGQAAAGCWINLFNPMAAEMVAQAGYDFVMIDMEHGPGAFMDAIAVMQAINADACEPLLRVSANDPVLIKRALDAGATGLMVPAVNSRQEAEAAVAACRYPPAGVRGVAPTIVRASRYGAEWQDYAARANEDTLVICQIESETALEAAVDIAGVEGVDMLFIGPFDLSASMGFLGQPDHPEVRSRIETVEKIAKGAGRLLGGIPTGERSAKDLYEAGYDLVLAGSDLLLLREALYADAARLRDAISDRQR